MTNFSQISQKKKFVTPERAVFFIPVLISLVLSSILLPTIFFPRTKIIRERKSEIDLLQSKIDYIPQYKLRLAEVLSIYNDIDSQNKRLIDLLAGEKDLSTVLSKLNSLALDQSVTILEVKPKEKISTLISNDSLNKNKELINQNSEYNDKLLVKSIEKYPIELKIRGNYMNILNFIRDLELLQTIVISSDLELTKQNELALNKANSSSLNENNIIMNFTITFYGRKTLDKSLNKKDLLNKFSLSP